MVVIDQLSTKMGASGANSKKKGQKKPKTNEISKAPERALEKIKQKQKVSRGLCSIRLKPSLKPKLAVINFHVS